MTKGKKRTRANNGMGSIRQRADGRWEARYTAPNNGQKSVYGATEKEVTAKLRKKLHEIDIGAWCEPSRMTVATWLQIWLSDYQGHNTERTVRKYRCITNKHFIPVLGKMQLAKVLPLHVRRLINDMHSLQPVTIKNYIRILSAAMQRAVEAGLIRDNPVDNAKLPRVPPANFCVIDRTLLPAFTTAANKTPYPNELLFMLMTGLRIGEIRGLQWGDCDLDAGTMHVQRQLHPANHDSQRFSEPKYGEDRIIHIPDEAVTILRNQRRLQSEQRLASGNWVDDDISHDLIFRLPDGRAHNEHTIYMAVKAAGAAIGKPELHPHDLRHSYAIAALCSGVDVKTVQHNLGHKTAQMTLDVYAAYVEDAGKEGASKLSAYLKNTLK
jgi:integrase